MNYSNSEMVLMMVAVLAVIWLLVMAWEKACEKWDEWDSEAAKYPEDFYNYD